MTDDQNLSCLNSDLLQNHPRVLKRFLLDKSETLTPSDISRRRLLPPKPLTPASPNRMSKYPVEKAKDFMKAVAEAGFGTLATVRAGKRYFARGNSVSWIVNNLRSCKSSRFPGKTLKHQTQRHRHLYTSLSHPPPPHPSGVLPWYTSLSHPPPPHPSEVLPWYMSSLDRSDQI